MTCSGVKDKLGFYLDGVLDEHTLEAVEAHLAACPECRREYASMKLLVTVAGQVKQLEPPEDLKRKILQSVRETESNRERCSQVSGLLSAYIDDELPRRQSELVEAHIQCCHDCASELAALRSVVHAAGGVAPVETPAGLRTRIAAAIVGQRPEGLVVSIVRRIGEMLQPSPRKAAWAGAAAALIAIAVISIPDAPKGADNTMASRRRTRPMRPPIFARSSPPVPVIQHQIAAVEPTATAAVYRPAKDSDARRIAKRNTAARTTRIAKQRPGRTKARPVVVATSPTNTTDQSATTTQPSTEVAVAAVPTPTPVVEPKSRVSDQTEPVRMASARMAAMSKAQEVMAQVKVEMAMRRRESGSPTVAIFSSRF